jgi:hypothetical protein
VYYALWLNNPWPLLEKEMIQPFEAGCSQILLLTSTKCFFVQMHKTLISDRFMAEDLETPSLLAREGVCPSVTLCGDTMWLAAVAVEARLLTVSVVA